MDKNYIYARESENSAMIGETYTSIDNAKIIDITTGKVIAEIATNQSMDLDTALDFAGAIVINDENDPRWSDDEGNVILDGKRYDYDSLAIE